MFETEKERGLPRKTCWVTYGLQQLSTEKFLKVVQNILDGEYTLLGPNADKFQDVERDEELVLNSN
jgi:hypothetical protein